MILLLYIPVWKFYFCLFYQAFISFAFYLNMRCVGKAPNTMSVAYKVLYNKLITLDIRGCIKPANKVSTMQIHVQQKPKE